MLAAFKDAGLPSPSSASATSCPRRASLSQHSISRPSTSHSRTSTSSTALLILMADSTYKSCFDRHARATLAVQTTAHRATEARFQRDQIATAHARGLVASVVPQVQEKTVSGASYEKAQSAFEAADKAFKIAAAQAVSTERALSAAKRDLERARSGDRDRDPRVLYSSS